ncbi:MAG: methylcobamide--CoM methyltransferase [Armatimonadetes bacterium]|nr:methylcobamide--CoM methyltransferase [Armatimonadota bacterium]
MDEIVVINDWAQLDGILADFPDPNYPDLLKWAKPHDGRYNLAQFWFCLFERHWMLRGMTNALMDYYTDPDCVHKLFRKLTDFYLVVIERAAKEHGCHGVMISDDIGMQTGPFFSVNIFREFFKPYYKEMIEKAHSLGMHLWLHACGNIEHFLPDFVEIGLDVIHPIQKHTMDEKVIAAKYGQDICIWAGFDVQQVIPWGTPEEVRAEVRYMIDTFQRPNGKLIFTAGNGINGDCSLQSLEALFEEALEYGSKI